MRSINGQNSDIGQPVRRLGRHSVSGNFIGNYPDLVIGNRAVSDKGDRETIAASEALWRYYKIEWGELGAVDIITFGSPV